MCMALVKTPDRLWFPAEYTGSNIFSPHWKGNIKGSEALPQMVRWFVRRGPHTGIFVPFAFFLPSPLLFLLCILSFLLPTSKASLPESHKTSVLTKNTGMPLQSFKGDFAGIGDSIETLLMSHWIFSATFPIDKHRGEGYSHGNSKHHRKLKTHGARRQKASHYRKK